MKHAIESCLIEIGSKSEYRQYVGKMMDRNVILINNLYKLRISEVKLLIGDRKLLGEIILFSTQSLCVSPPNLLKIQTDLAAQQSLQVKSLLQEQS